MNELKKKSTEMRNQNSMNLDELSSLEIVRLMNNEDKKVIDAVRANDTIIAGLIDEVIRSFNNNGRLIYIGSGTSGRLGVLDASECPPTFGTDPKQVLALISGGYEAAYTAKEGMEDNKEKAVEDLKEINLTSNDVLVGIAASGSTPYVIRALEYAKELGCMTGSICCNKSSPISKISDYPIEAVVGPEVLTGSTRLKSGTAQKMILNMISTGSMVGVGKVFENLMVDVKPTNNKLVKRARSIVMEITGASEIAVIDALEKSNNNVKAAIVMIINDLEYEQAIKKLDGANGFLREAINGL